MMLLKWEEQLLLPKITKQFFEDRNGEKITINNDYHGKLRNQNTPMPGPFSFKESLDKLKVWPK